MSLRRGSTHLVAGKVFFAGGTEEHFILIQPEARGDFADQLRALLDLYDEARRTRGLGDDSGVWATVFLSDSANQEPILRADPAIRGLTGAGLAMTVVQQPPVGGTKLALLAYHLRRADGPITRRPLTVSGVKGEASAFAMDHGPYRFVHLKNLLAAGGGSAGEQMEQLLDAVIGRGLQWPEVIRTWIYVDPIDVHYGAVSVARNQVFDRAGVTGRAGFPASTGIEGRTADHADRVLLDALAIQGLEPDQSRRMQARSHLSPTVDYGVRFERGREVVFGDRRHLYLSGTASIDRDGRILFPGDVARQAERAIENVATLLAASGSDTADLGYALFYLRDPTDLDVVEAVKAESPLRDIPHLAVHAPVCRPGWLVELEGIAIDAKGESRFAPF